MSSIAGISSGSGLDIAQLLRKLAAAKTSSTGAAATNSSSSQTVESGDREQKFESAMAQALGNLGVSSDDISDIQEEIKSAIAASVQEGGASEDPRDGIKSAVDDVLTKHGLDPEAVQKEFRSIAGPPQGGPPPGGPGGPPPSAGSSASGASSTSADSLIQRLLQSGTLDDSTAQILQGLLATVDTTA